MHRLLKYEIVAFLTSFALLFPLGMACMYVNAAEETKPIQIEDITTVTIDEVVVTPHPLLVASSEEEIVEEVVVEEIEDAVVEELPTISQEEIELIALVTMAEAESESEMGKRLVIDTILNRVDSDLSYFPDTITQVIYQPDQFSPIWDGRINDCYVDEDICQLVREELKSRTNYDVLYFHADKYGKYGTPLFAEGNHYFSSI